jgi:hypothetical protein
MGSMPSNDGLAGINCVLSFLNACPNVLGLNRLRFKLNYGEVDYIRKARLT